MYRKGDLAFVDPPCDTFDEVSGQCDTYEDGHKHFATDARDDNYEGVRSPCAYLPHSCDEWVIGDSESIRMLIADLENALLTNCGLAPKSD